MSWFGKKTFAHGVHPPESKQDTAGLAIRQFGFAPLLAVPLSQHIGKPAVATVREGQEVLRGESIGRPDGFLSVAMHAPASGVVRRLGLVPSASGKLVPGVYLEPFPASTQEVAVGRPCDVETATPAEILAAIQQAGVVGLGGAAFPTHAKLTVPAGHAVDAVIINGVECEPYLTTDHRVMLEQTSDVIHGVRYVLKATGAARAIIGVEANKPDAARALASAVPEGLPISVEVLEVKYPQGAEKMLIKALLDREVPSGGFPYQAGALCINVATTAEIGRLLPKGRGVQERVVTVGGPGVVDKGNYRIAIGTPLRYLLETVGVTPKASRVLLGGPMMGPTISSLDIPITKGISGVLVLTEGQTGDGAFADEQPCIRCGACVEACPMALQPSELALRARNQAYASMADELHLMDCFECGSCSFVCPSHIPLVQYFRMAKAAVRRPKVVS